MTWFSRGVNKATDLSRLRGIMVKHSRDEIAVFGDSMNDYAMLRYLIRVCYGQRSLRTQNNCLRLAAPSTEQAFRKKCVEFWKSFGAAGYAVSPNCSA